MKRLRAVQPQCGANGAEPHTGAIAGMPARPGQLPSGASICDVQVTPYSAAL